MATATERFERPIVLANRTTVVVLTAAAVLTFNLLIYAVGRAGGGAFRYTHSGKATTVDALAVTFLSVLPLTIGLTLVGWLSRRWPALITTAKVVAAVLAVATIGLMTIPARFDTTSTLCLATMHLALAPAAVLALGALAPRRCPYRAMVDDCPPMSAECDCPEGGPPSLCGHLVAVGPRHLGDDRDV